jgi:serine/threonine protein kinase
LEKEKTRQGSILNIKTVRELAEDIIPLLYGLHTRGYAHRDIKPENFLVTAAKTLVLADLGGCIRCNTSSITTAYGTDGYRAPEIVKIEERRIAILNQKRKAAETVKKQGNKWDGKVGKKPLQPLKITNHRALDMWALGATLLKFRTRVR